MVCFEAKVNHIKFTERALSIMKFAENEAGNSTKIVYPFHLLLGILLERSGVCAELFLHFPNLYESLKERLQKMKFNNPEKGIQTEFFNSKITESSMQVLENASKKMERYRQVYINEGLLLKAIFDINDETTKAIMEGVDVSKMMEILSNPRDMVVSLKDYSIPNLTPIDLIFRKATIEDTDALKDFVQAEFGKAWMESVENGLQEENIPIYIAIQNEKILGFASFDVVRKMKGLFGPMGTAISNRTQGIGYRLLHNCLKEMKDIGYEYAVIGEAGPLEFYEKACNAVVIPKSF